MTPQLARVLAELLRHGRDRVQAVRTNALGSEDAFAIRWRNDLHYAMRDLDAVLDALELYAQTTMNGSAE